MNLLTVKNLTVTFSTDNGPVDVVKGISFNLGKERLGIVGESGSGKSMTGRAILGLIEGQGKVTADELKFKDTDLQTLSKTAYRTMRGKAISMVMQDPKYSLNPVISIGRQISEVLEFHEKLSKKERYRRVIQILEAVHIRDAERVYHLYPHEISGGMGQRVMIAMMVVLEPDVLIADEPTSALDASVQAQVLDIMNELVQVQGMGLIMISHDLNMVAKYCDRILVMFNGEIVESCIASELSQATHPYTQGLLASMPTIDESRSYLPVLDRTALGRV
ncbi:ABC transporter ATP-binding protein [Kangiella sp.]|uniref:ABC transporter ATP-binding protein n=1 Tax=Kangiella sp. TaxID=1920245 RepID=UPI003A9368D6